MTNEETASKARAEAVAALEAENLRQRQIRRDDIRSSADFFLSGATIVFTAAGAFSILWLGATLLPMLGNPNTSTRTVPWLDLGIAVAGLGNSLFFAGVAKWLRSRPHS